MNLQYRQTKEKALHAFGHCERLPLFDAMRTAQLLARHS